MGTLRTFSPLLITLWFSWLKSLKEKVIRHQLSPTSPSKDGMWHFLIFSPLFAERQEITCNPIYQQFFSLL